MKQIRANEQIKQQLPHTQEKGEDATGKIAPLFKKDIADIILVISVGRKKR